MSLPQFSGSKASQGLPASGGGADDGRANAQQVFVLFGVEDHLGAHRIVHDADAALAHAQAGGDGRVRSTSCSSPVGTYLNEPWDVFLARTQIHSSELWHDGEPQTARNARLFPMVSLSAAGGSTDGSHLLKLVLWMQDGDAVKQSGHTGPAGVGVSEDEVCVVGSAVRR